MTKLTFCIAVAFLAATSYAQQAVVYEGGRLIVGDGSAAIENGAFVVQNGHIAAIGAAIKGPAGATRVNLAGKTVMPALINVHVHIGYEKYTSWGAKNYTAENVLDHLQREAFYGVAATQSVGSSPLEASLQFQRDQQAGKFPPASRYFFIPGYAPPNGGPDEVLREATNALHAINEVSTGEEARASVRKMAGLGIKAVKIWVDDRRGTYPKMMPEVYNAIIDEAHKHGMLVHAHATTLADQKAVVRAGADVLVHLVQGEKLDDEYLALLREKKPYWATVISLGDPTAVCEHDPFFEQAMPASVIAKIRATTVRRPLAPSCGPAGSECGQPRGHHRIQFSEDDRGWRASRAGHRYRDRAWPHFRLGRTCGDGAMGAAWADAVAGDHRRDPTAGRVAGSQRHGDARRGQARRFHRARREPTGEHP